MNLFVRLALVILAALRAPRRGYLEPSRLRFRVLPTDLDVNLHMNNARYFALMDLGRVDLMLRAGLGRAILANRWQPVLGAATVRFRRPLRPFQRFELVSRVLCWDEKWLYLEHRLELAGVTAAVAVVQGAFLAPGRGTVPPSEIAGAVGSAAASPPMPDFVAGWRPQTLPV